MSEKTLDSIGASLTESLIAHRQRLEAQLAEADAAFSMLLGDQQMQQGTDRMATLMRGIRGKCNPAEAKQLLEWRETQAQLAEAKAVLRKVEWASQETDEGGGLPPQCMACDRYQHQGHAPDCRLAKVLK